MNGIFGLLHRDGSPVAQHDLERLASGMSGPREDVRISLQESFGAGIVSPHPVHSQAPFFAASGRIDNWAELCAALGITARDLEPGGDAELMRRAWEHWGEATPGQLFGDWAFAAWNPVTRTLFLARDHSGNTALYYYESSRALAFATSRRALLALHLETAKLNEFYLARVLVSWSIRGNGETAHHHLKRLPASRTLTVTPERTELRQYWRLEETPELRLPDRRQYAEAFRDVFDRAVHDRLGNAPVATMLSGGLDSGSVASTAAYLLRQSGRRLPAFTSVPLHGTSLFVGGNKFGDELPYARATAEAAGNIDLYPVDAAQLTPVQAIRRLLDIIPEPQHAAGNLYWLLEIFRGAAAQGNAVLLTGQLGNGGVSWNGDPFSHPLSFRIRQLGIAGWMQENVRRHVLHQPGIRSFQMRRRRSRLRHNLAAETAIHPAFARRIELEERWMEAIRSSPTSLTPMEKRGRMGLQDVAALGAFYAEMSAAWGIEMRDPTGDARVLSFALSVPDEIYMDPQTGMDRWLIREAMKDRLPDMVRLNRIRGRQAADLAPRLRASAPEVEAELDGIARGPAAEYVDVAQLRNTWQKVLREDSMETFLLAVTVLTRGLMAGIFVNEFGRYS